MRVAVVGAGFGGLGAAVRLGQVGADVTVYEKADGVGGVWRANTYPGAACDVPSHLYSFSFAPKTDWSRRYGTQPEILAYLEGVADAFHVRGKCRFGVEVLCAEWTGSVWRLELSDGSTAEADVLVPACGQLSRPAVPELPGLEEFAGPAFHSASWRHDVDLTGKAVAVLGTGASAIQFVPEIAEQAGRVTVFQRHAPYVLPKHDPDYVKPRTATFNKLQRVGFYAWNELRTLPFNNVPKLMAPLQASFKRHLENHVSDPALREALTPQERMGCKRILISDRWYAALTRSNVDLVRSEVVAVEPHGVRDATGAVTPADVIVFGTGFRATEFLTPMRVVGAGGRELSEAWQGGAQAHLGITVPGFPNLFLVYGPNTNLGHNSIVYMIESQLTYLVDAVRRLMAGRRPYDVRPEVWSAFSAQVQERTKKTVFATGCSSWYRDPSGTWTQNWPASTLAYRWATRRVREADFA